MKIVVMSDTHLSRVTEEFESLCSAHCPDADMVIHLGDWERVDLLDFLEQYPLRAVAGNMDDHRIRERLPVKRIIRAGDFRIGIIHGWGAPGGIRQRLGEEFTGVDAILFGHTHQPLLIREDGLLWFNPGSVTTARGNSRAGIGVLRIGERIEAEIISI